MRQAGHILIDREDRERAIRTLLEVARRFSGCFSVVIFPEGTRSPGRHLLRFKRGGFHLARELGLPILPVSISRSQAIMDRHSLNLHPGEVKVHFHPPVDPEDFERLDDLVQAVRGTVAAGIEDLEPEPSE
jgi:1-acyl-sn-glycerol-3-phosphate acyltransferase